ncbi:MAG: RsmG family class I SAM-dependent methyltransferase [Acidobacteriota bacterium]
MISRLHSHYEELRRWNSSLSLIGPGTAEQLVERHYGEALLAETLLPCSPSTLVDVGSGAGFPGLVLAAMRPEWAVTLVEARERKSAFLAAASRRMALPVHCLNARVTKPLPPGLPLTIDVLTVRAVRVDSQLIDPLMPRLSPHARVLLWSGEDVPRLSDAWELTGEVGLGGAKRILAFGSKGV